MWWTLLAACNGDDDDAAHTASPEAPCAVTPDNALRIACTWADGPGTLHVVGDDVDRTFTGVDGAVVAYGLRQLTTYTATLSVEGSPDRTSTITTPALPASLALTFVELEPGPSHLEHLLFPTACGAGAVQIYVTDPDGEVRWYSGTGVTGGLTGFDVSDDGVVILAGRRWVRELRWDGAIGADAERDLDSLVFPHHAVDVLGDRIVVLDTRPRDWPTGQYLDDGVAEVRGSELVNVFRLGDVYDPQGRTGFPPAYWTGVFPDATDATHLNSVELLPDGGFLLSAKHLDAILAIDPEGALRYAIPGSTFAPDFGALALTAGSGVAFEFPHHVNVAPWGNLLVFDNGRNFTDSDVVELAVDEVAHTVTLVRRWPLGVSCPVQSSAYGLPDGTVVATCAARREVFELADDPATEAPVRRRFRVDCAEGEAAGLLVRTRPLSGW